jgi:hypothetical protein
MSGFEMFTMPTPIGRVTYVLQGTARSRGEAAGVMSDATLDVEDGTPARSLSHQELAGYLEKWGPATRVWPRAERAGGRADRAERSGGSTPRKGPASGGRSQPHT